LRGEFSPPHGPKVCNRGPFHKALLNPRKKNGNPPKPGEIPAFFALGKKGVKKRNEKKIKKSLKGTKRPIASAPLLKRNRI